MRLFKNCKDKFQLQQGIALLVVIFTSCNLKEDPTLNDKFIVRDNFENGLSHWDVNNPEKIRIVDAIDPNHGQVLEMHPGGSNTFVLLRDHDSLTNLRIEGDVLFPEYEHNYLGVIYNHNVRGVRADYGCIYIKGNGSYARVNPHRDGNVSRILYDEYKTNLVGSDTIQTGKWQHFRAEISGPVCHFYVGNMQTPKITYNFHEFNSGRIGFEPRVTGSHVWIDNIVIQSIDELSYKGPSQPDGIVYEPNDLLTDWKVTGPYRNPLECSDSAPFKFESAGVKWEQFEADGRGCIVVGKVLEWTSLKTYAYFATNIEVDQDDSKTLEFSSGTTLKVWLNDEFVGDINGGPRAWYDFYRNKDHAGQKLEVKLKRGRNELIIRVSGRGWKGYAGDGFFAKVHID